MNNWRKVYEEKILTAQEIAKQIDSNTVCATPIAAGAAFAITDAIAERALKENLTGIKHFALLSLGPSSLFNEELNGKLNHVTTFSSTDAARKAIWENRADVAPCFYFEQPKLVTEFIKPEIFYATVSPMDDHGYFSFGTSVSNVMAMKKCAKKIFLEVNENMPKTHGNCFIHISEVDAICECNRPLPELPVSGVSDLEMTIGRYIADLVPDEATIQLGIGGIPNAAAIALSDKKDLGIHTEMFTESMIDLIEQGIVTNRKKKLHEGKSITTFALGSRRMYDYLNDNVGVEFYPVDYVNDPNVVGMHDNFISINSCIEVDLFGQVCAESIGPKHFSGVGGQVDYVRGASRSKGGKSIIAIQSTAKKGTITKIKPILTPGSIVTTSRNDVDYIVTEYGVAHLKGNTMAGRAKSLIAISHPDFREQLTFEAKKMGLF
jgi:acyl-CoA hydrolase